MQRQVEMSQLTQVSDAHRVRHIDEFSPTTKERLPEVINAGNATIEYEIARELEDCDVVKFTDYYEVSIT